MPAYEVDLEQCLDGAQVLDWILQVAGKQWADDATVAGLVRERGLQKPPPVQPPVGAIAEVGADDGQHHG